MYKTCSAHSAMAACSAQARPEAPAHLLHDVPCRCLLNVQDLARLIKCHLASARAALECLCAACPLPICNLWATISSVTGQKAGISVLLRPNYTLIRARAAEMACAEHALHHDEFVNHSASCVCMTGARQLALLRVLGMAGHAAQCAFKHACRAKQARTLRMYARIGWGYKRHCNCALARACWYACAAALKTIIPPLTSSWAMIRPACTWVL